MAPADLIELHSALLHFTESVHPGDMGHVNDVMAAAAKALAGRGLGPEPRAERQLVALLSTPLKK